MARPKKVPAAKQAEAMLVKALRDSGRQLAGSAHGDVAVEAANRIEALEQAVKLAIGTLAAKL